LGKQPPNLNQPGKDLLKLSRSSERTKKFISAFKVISENIDAIYKDLTRNRGSRAYLTLENLEEPYSEGIKYNAIPPQKTFRDMEQLSGGEKTLAALALLFAIHSFQPSPFFVLDEVDADLDQKNVSNLSAYIRKRSSDLQCIVISLKESFYEKADALVGVYKDKTTQSSGVLTIDLTSYLEEETQ